MANLRQLTTFLFAVLLIIAHLSSSPSEAEPPATTRLPSYANVCDQNWADRAYELTLFSCSQVLRLDPKNAKALLNRGRAYLGLREYRLAEYDLNRANSILTNQIDSHHANAVTYYLRALVRRTLSNSEGALTDVTTAIKIDPHFLDAFVLRAYIYVGDFLDDARAEADYSSAISLDPSISPTYAGRGIVRLNQEKYEGAISDFDRALQDNPFDKLLNGYRIDACRKLPSHCKDE
ncbi:MAG: hypothetical protein JNM27_21275 [Leptospirales bacterium]|nr:hypothetical protein [Leptospirales bacterium]